MKKQTHENTEKENSPKAKEKMNRFIKKFRHKDKNKHMDGIKRIRCPGGILEKDIDTYFQLHQDQAQDRQHHTPVDLALRMLALEKVRAHGSKGLQDTELTIVGDVCAVRFVSGKGRDKIRLEPKPESGKICIQVRIENIFFGFFRLLLFLASMTEAALSVLSLHIDDDKVTTSWATEEQLSTKIVLCGGHVTGAMLGLLAALETINPNPSLFFPKSQVNHFGEETEDTLAALAAGLWPLGRHRWLVRSVTYAALTSQMCLHTSLTSPDGWLSFETFPVVCNFSYYMLQTAAVLSIVLWLVTLCAPSLLKAPWSRTTLPSSHSASSSSSDLAIPSTPSFLYPLSSSISHYDSTVSLSSATDNSDGWNSHASVDALWVGEDFTKDAGHCDERRGVRNTILSDYIQLHATCSVIVSLRWLAYAPLCLSIGTTLLLFVCHVTRLAQTAADSPQTSITSALNCVGITTAVSISLVAAFLHRLCARRFQLTCNCWTSAFVYVVSVSTLWSRDVVTWLWEHVGWSKSAIGVTLLAVSLTMLFLPLFTGILVFVKTRIDDSSGKTDQTFTSWLCPPHIPWEKVRRLTYMIAVLISVFGMALAVIALTLPMARVQAQYTSDLKEMVDSLKEVHSKADNHWNHTLDFMEANPCVGRDLASLKEQIEETEKTASSVSTTQLKTHCDQMGWETAVTKHDPVCLRYGAAKLFFNDKKVFDDSVMDKRVLDLKSANESTQNKYLDEVLQASRSEQVSDLNHAGSNLVERSDSVNEVCLKSLCFAKAAALVTMMIPFVGIWAKVVYVGLAAAESVLRVLIQLSTVQNDFKEFRQKVTDLMAMLQSGEEEKIVQFSFVNFSLMYFVYAPLLTGLMTVSLGFWHRTGTPASHCRRASLFLLLPRILFSIFGVVVTITWTSVMQFLGDKAPLVQATVAPLAAIKVGRASNLLALISNLLFLLLALLPSPFPSQRVSTTVTDGLTSETEEYADIEHDTKKAHTKSPRKNNKHVTPTNLAKKLLSRVSKRQKSRKAGKKFEPEFEEAKPVTEIALKFLSKFAKVKPTKGTTLKFVSENEGPKSHRNSNIMLPSKVEEKIRTNRQSSTTHIQEIETLGTECHRTMTPASDGEQFQRDRSSGGSCPRKVVGCETDGQASKLFPSERKELKTRSKPTTDCSSRLKKLLTTTKTTKTLPPEVGKSQSAKETTTDVEQHQRDIETTASSVAAEEAETSFEKSPNVEVPSVSDDEEPLTAVSTRQGHTEYVRDVGSTSKTNEEEKTYENVIKVTNGVESRAQVYMLPLALSILSTCLVSVVFWKPIFVLRYDFTTALKDRLHDTDKAAVNNQVARALLLASDQTDACDIVNNLISKVFLDKFMHALKNMDLGVFRTQLRHLLDKAQASTPSVSLELIQVPLTLAVYLPVIVLTWAAFTCKLRPRWSPAPRLCARLYSTGGWFLLGWLTSGLLSLVSLTQSEIVPFFTVSVQFGQGIPFAIAASLVLIWAVGVLGTEILQRALRTGYL